MQSLVNELVGKILEEPVPAIPSGSAVGTWSFTGTASGVMTPEQVNVLREFVERARDSSVYAGTELVLVVEGFLSMVEHLRNFWQ
jgi:hypothetical protein